MLHPIGEQPQSVYWRRRIAVLAVVALAFLSMYAFIFRGSGSGNGKHGAGGAAPSQASSHAAAGPTAATTKAVATTSPAPSMCLAAQLVVAASTNAKTYPIGGKPTVSLVVTNKGPAPCVADLSDAQIELRVMSGAARVWDSHDCVTQGGQSLQTLLVGVAVRRDVSWAGLSSQPGCAGQRQQVPAGSYTLIAIFAGLQSAPVPFSFTS